MPYRYEPLKNSEEELRSAGLDRGFHGTSHPLIGDKILPGDKVGVPKTYDMSSDDVANYVAAGPLDSHTRAAERRAWAWATHSNSHLPLEGNRPRVHSVEAEGHPMVDLNISTGRDVTQYISDPVDGGMPPHMGAPALRVTDTQWTPPPSRKAMEAGRGVEGSLPHINWRQFSNDPREDSYARNPGDTDIWMPSRAERERAEALDAPEEAPVRKAEIPGQMGLGI